MAGEPSHEFDKLESAGSRIVDSLYHRVFEYDASPRFVKIVFSRLYEFFYLERFIDGHYLIPYPVIRRVQRYRQSNAVSFVGEAVYLIRKTRSRKRYIPFTDIDTSFVAYETQKLSYVIVVIKRLSASHKYDVGNAPFISIFGGVSIDFQNLRKYLSRR